MRVLTKVLRVAIEKTPQGSRRTLAMRASLHKEVATADTQLRAARSLFYQVMDAAWEHAQEQDETIATPPFHQNREMYMLSLPPSALSTACIR